MLNIFKKWFPVVIVLSIIINLIASYSTGNTEAVNANFMALIGWIVITVEGFLEKKQASE